MAYSVEETFAHLDRLGDPAVNAGLLAALDARRGPGERHLARANLLRRMGDLPAARAVMAAWAERETAPPGLRLDEWSAVPAGLFSQDGYAIAPIVLVDDFLDRERMAALHAHACERAEFFRDALATNEDRPPSYDPDRRQTLLDYAFKQERTFFSAFIEGNLAALCDSLGLHRFATERYEIKLTNHLDGGFFKTHSDNHATFRDAGRAITWIYYFGKGEPQFSGGDLLVLDSKPAIQSISPVWFSRIMPLPNRFIAFPSWFYHAVTPIRLEHNGFDRGRFAVSGHVRKRGGGHPAWWEK